MTEWEDLHNANSSWRKTLVGQISDLYTVPKYLGLFREYFGREKGLDTLELGAGNGDLSMRLVSENKGGIIGSYTVSENYEEGVRNLRARGMEAKLINAENTGLGPGSYDLVCAFDIMHHVKDPRAMAREMARISRKYIFLTEANGLSLGRKLFERKKMYRDAGERSYLPRVYRSFFDAGVFKELGIEPFLFVFKTPERFIKHVIAFSEAIEKIPVLRWQCASLVIFGEKRT
ncbi:MAG: class I SAM-dependent methyltransferase [Candidatus Omnitrophica bacterium]|nr:class I SAM-dependent methyltransferase [Candidatus Omnitrophota bacterium]